MLTFDNVYQAPLDKMKAAADNWSEMKGKLEKLAEDARTTMAAKAKDEYWRGVNAEVTKPFVDKTAKEFDDAAKAAGGIHRILEDGYNAFKKAKDDLKKIVDVDAPAQHLLVKPDGKVEARNPLSAIKDPGARHDPDYPELVRKERAAIDAMQRRIDSILETCDDADVACSNALKANITGDKHNFSAPKYGSIDAEEAQRALDLAKKGRALSHEELERLNELLKDNSSSKDFSRTFYNGLGPKGSLEFFGQLSTDTYEYGKLDEQRLKDVQELQRNLGLNLAAATQGGDKWTENWSAEMRKLGTERVPLAKNDYNGPFGYQLLGGIMRNGNYDPKFLNPIVEHVTQLHAKDPDLFAGNKRFGGWQPNPFNPSGVNGAGYDPMVSMLEALGHSPEAAKQFFSAEPTSYKEDGAPGGDLSLGKNKDGEDITTYLEFFANEKYERFPDVDSHHPDEVKKSADFMPDALGHALEAATLGHAWDDPNPKFGRDETTAKIMKDVVATYGDAELLKKHQSSMADSLGTMGAGYIDDLNWALTKNDPENVYAPKSLDAEVRAAHPEFGREATVAFLSALGQHPDAYATVSTAERIYATSVLEAQVGSDGQINEGRAKSAVYTSGMLQGLLDQARADQVEAEGMKVHEDYEKAQAKKSAWIGFGTTAAIAAGVAFLPATAAAAGAAAVLVPLAVETGSGAMETLAGQVIGDWSDKSAEKHKDDIEGGIREEKTSLYTAGRYSAEAPMERFVMQHRSQVGDDFKQELIESSDHGYIQGNSRENQQGNDPQTD
ncbi:MULTISPECIES: DUF6571 family protein [Streptomyces]|uniref:DUF6571 family protein n=1 Tax=Streptomyces TaxID=1883 RepID=UPI00131829B3|nr:MULTISPECIES: DUF6571 family protein [Streptomyces]QGZ49176.1 hypothetical protein GPZ77_12985 [Streptomyces sp. QHH-9511]GGT90856.1 hypothetical protein GCM10010272_39560 [Streptomyces lateritius]